MKKRLFVCFTMVGFFRFDCFHSWFDTHAILIAYAGGPGGTQSVTLYGGHGTVSNLTVPAISLYLLYLQLKW